MTAGPVCAFCGEGAVVQWRRRPTDDEVAEVVAVEQERRKELLRLADPQLPAPSFGPLPTAGDMTRTVYACAGHAISLEAAARIHASACTAPNDADLPGCDCTPEPLPESTPVDAGPVSELPEQWLPGGQ
ncbi:hypothetical protein [Streptomyces sp. BBFR109]|uniref:hypothetical protein n=1 Tax=Streptomyces sp. BBFR109 TaxID=3448172 RepID=UPI003F7582B5